jgi:CubicO group peptidase (beta-lactamase class C family)
MRYRIGKLPGMLATAGLAFLLAAHPALSKEIPNASPEDVGLSEKRLARIGAWLESEIAANKIPGAVVLVARRGKIAYHEAFGKLGPGSDAPMPKDAIFRIYSMTKPIATVAAMSLVEEGKLRLETPISAYIPAFKDMKVAVEKPAADGGQPTVEMQPARRPITVQDLMRHTSGLTYGFFGKSPAKQAYLDNDIGTHAELTLEEFADRIAAMPLGFHPGTTWDYSYSTDVLGRVVEVVAGKPLEDVLRERVFGPLDMNDTAFYVTDPEKQKRIAEPFEDDRTIGAGAVFNDPRVAGKMQSAGGGLTGTARDYARFAQMLVNGGALGDTRILGTATLAYMTTDHLGSAIDKGKLYLPGPGYGFGLGFGVRTEGGIAPYPGSVGEYYWGGAGGTYFWVDPKQELTVVFMMQSPKNRVPYRSVIRNLVYGAIVD